MNGATEPPDRVGTTTTRRIARSGRRGLARNHRIHGSGPSLLAFLPLVAGPLLLFGAGEMLAQEPGAEPDGRIPEGFHEVRPVSGPAAVEAWNAEDRIWTRALFVHFPFATEIVVRSGPSFDHGMVAWLRVSEGVITLAAREAGLEGGLIRVGHEEYGLPGHRIADRWIEVTFGVTESGDPRRGWARVPTDEPYAGVLRRSEMFVHCGGGYLTEPDRVELYGDREGDRIELRPGHPALAPEPDAPFDDRLELLSVEDDWLHVRDSEYAEFWLELRDGRGRFQMDYDRGHCSPPLGSSPTPER